MQRPDRPRDCHTEWNKSEREEQISLLYGIWKNFIVEMKLIAKQKYCHKCREQIYG